MSDSGNTHTSGGIGILGILFIVFLVLKLAEIGAVASWSWWAVTAPLWGGFLGIIVLTAVVGICASLAQGWR